MPRPAGVDAPPPPSISLVCGTRVVEYLMQHACPAYLQAQYPGLAAAVRRGGPPQPLKPKTGSLLGDYRSWLHWPPGYTAGAAVKNGGAAAPPKKRGRRRRA